MSMPTWIHEAQAVGTIFVGIGVVGIALQQLRISHRKLKLDLYERRYQIYDALVKYRDDAFTNDRNTEIETVALQKRLEAKFLLDEKLACFVNEFVSNIVIYRNVLNVLNNPSITEETRNACNDDLIRYQKLVIEQDGPLSVGFKRFLTVDEKLSFGIFKNIAKTLNLRKKKPTNLATTSTE